MPEAKRAHWTRAEVQRLIEDNPLVTPRHELVDGELFVTPSPGYLHQRAVAELYVALREYVRRLELGRVYFSPSDIELEPETLVQPDLYVVSPEIDRDAPVAGIRSLLLAVEVLSPGSARGDRGRKRLLYQRTVPEYWIVDVDARLVERWTPGDERPEIIRDTLTWKAPGAAPEMTLDIGALFADIWNET